MNYHTHTLPCGLRIVMQPTDSPVAYLGFVIAAGTRHEDDADSGMAHFLEHMTFKGTARRRAAQITNGLERVGGELNAFTTKQETIFHATVLTADFVRAADLLADIVFHSTYPQTEMEREVEVICDEIDSYRDTPSDLIFDHFETLLFGNHTLGRDILGMPERLRSYRTADALRFAHRHYVPQNAVFYLSGNVPFGRVLRTMERLFSDFPQAEPILCPENDGKPHATFAAPTVETVHRDTHQAHVIVGGPAMDASDKRRHALFLLNNVLGGPGMNSRLNVRLRERAGLVYGIDSYVNLYPDTGYWNLYFGCDPSDAKRCLRLVRSEMRRLAEQPLGPAALAAAKKQLRGQTLISYTHSESRAVSLGRNYSRYGSLADPTAYLGRIDAVSAEDLRSLAREIYRPEALTTLMYVP